MPLQININDLPLKVIFEIIRNKESRKNEIDQLIQFINKAPVETIVQIINQPLCEYGTTILGYSAEYCVLLFKKIVQRIPERNLDFSKVGYSSFYAIREILYKDTDLFIEKLANTPELNSHCGSFWSGEAIFLKMICESKFLPHKMLKILQSFPLETVNFNVSQNATYRHTALVIIIKSAVETNSPFILDALLNRAPFRNLDFANANIYVQEVGRYSNVIHWLARDSFAFYVPKIIDAGIKQGHELCDNLFTNSDNNENSATSKFKIFEEHLKKLDEFVSVAQDEKCAELLKRFYAYTQAKAAEVLEQGIKKSRALYDCVLANINNNENIDEVQYNALEEHLKKLEYLFKKTKAFECDYKLAQFYEELGLQGRLKDFAKQLSSNHPYRAKIFDILGHLAAYNLEKLSNSSSDEERIEHKKQLLKALKYSLEGEDSMLRTLLGIKTVYEGVKGAEFFPSQIEDVFIHCLGNLKPQLTKDDKKMILTTFKLRRETEDLKIKKCCSDDETNERGLQISKKTAVLFELEKKLSALSF